MGVNTAFHNLPNPLGKIKRRFTRYAIIMATTGVVSFLVALALLYHDISPFLSLIISVSISGLLNYALLELWAFPHRKGKLSMRRLSGSALVGATGFAARYGVLLAGLNVFQPFAPLDKAMALGCAYLASFLIGYSLRTLIVFKKDPSKGEDGRSEPGP